MIGGPTTIELGFFAIFLAYLIFWVYTLIDCAQNEPREGNTTIIWILIILFGMGVGPVIYFLVRRPERISTLGR